MAPKDYKNRTKRQEMPVRFCVNWIPFATGLVLGLFLSSAAHLWPWLLHRPTALVSSIASGLKSNLNIDSSSDLPAEPSELPSPTFDFYNILPEMEVPIRQWPLSSDDENVTLEPGSYVLQVGSFKRFDEADHVKARLAFLGVTARINPVVINGQDLWYRVHVGPLSNRADISAMRIKLIENDMDFMLLKIGAKTST